ncbi:MAG: hypothetical protein HKM98_05900 [Gammaproteobacteria bacterium]|nr:hypothetical protein [Gammaproteobacteria bacterium]
MLIKNNLRANLSIAFVAITLLHATVLSASEILGDGPRLLPEDRISQQQIENGEKTLSEIRAAGLTIFATPFNKHDGFGDGPHDLTVPDQRSAAAGNRPTLQGNGSFLRVNGLDAQSCLECHAIVSNRTVPATLGIGGLGGINTSAMFQPAAMSAADTDFDGRAEFDGRLINPPFIFGAGGVELVAREMTQDLQRRKRLALRRPGTRVELETKGVYFGSIVASSDGTIDTQDIEGIDADLVVRPFGRKGDVASLRRFDINALAFHMGMQANEAFGGSFADADNDGVSNEISKGDLSALTIFLSTLERPTEEHMPGTHPGERLFHRIGCAECHVPTMQTARTILPSTFADAPETPFTGVFYEIDLTEPPTSFDRNETGGIEVRMFSDLKRHDMGDALTESFSLASTEQNRQFMTARLWGVADSDPYMHDGRALTLVDAIRMHDNPGSEASDAARRFEAMDVQRKNSLLEFLLTLRTPRDPADDLLPAR